MTSILPVPEPLYTAVLGAARMMRLGFEGTSGHGGSPHDYAGLAKAYRAVMIDQMRQVIERETWGTHRQLTLREARLALPNGDVHDDFGFVARLTVCDAISAERVAPLWSYLVSASRGCTPGLQLRRVCPWSSSTKKEE